MGSQRRWAAAPVRARRLAYLLAGTALASVGFTGNAIATCNVLIAASNNVGCASNTTTTNTINLNGVIAASSDRTQEFNNGLTIVGSVGPGVTVDGFGLRLLLSNAGGNNALSLTNSGVVTTNQAVPAVQLNGNGGGVLYTGIGNVTNTGTGAGILVRNTGAGAVDILVSATSTIQSAGAAGVDVLTFGGGVNLQGFGGNVIGTTGASLSSNGGDISVSGLNLIQGTIGDAIVLSSLGGGITISNNLAITGHGSPAILASSDGGALDITGNGNITATGGGGGILASSGGGTFNITGNGNIAGINAHSVGGVGGITIANNGNIISTGDVGILAQSGTGGISIQGNGIISSAVNAAINASTAGGSIQIGNGTANGAITGASHGILATSAGGSISITTGNNITGTTATGITTNSGGGNQILLLNHSVSGATHGLNLTATGAGAIGVVSGGTIAGGTNAILGNSGGGEFDIVALGTINGAVNVVGANPATSVFLNANWITGTGNSVYSGTLNNIGVVNAQNAFAGQTISLGSYGGNGVLRLDLGDRVNATGASNLNGGSLNIVMAPNSTLSQSNVVLTSAGGLGGTTFATTSVTIPGVVATVTYTPTQVIVNVPAIQLGAGSNLNQNQQSVANGINGFFNGGGTLPASFVGLLGLPGPALASALTQMSGEVATGLQPSANLSMGMFLNAMIDPFVTGRSGGFGSATNYAPETPSRVEVAAREAFAADMPVKARPPIATFEQRWSIWGAAYGGQNRTDGDLAVGSNDLRATAAGFAAGADYRVSRDTVMGMAVAVGQTRWNVAAPAFGKGHSDVGQIGAYASTRWDNMYLSGAVAFAWHKAETDRTVTVAGTDRLEADFDATSIGGRLEGGYRFGGAQYGLTPYAAVQVQSLHTPAYSERATTGNNQFALTFGSQTTTDTRSELGFWADTRFLFAGNTMVLRGRAAWVHDYNPGSRINPAFQTLPGASFTINGAAAPRDAALTSAVAEMRLTSGWTLISKFDGEFSGRSTTVTGTGTARYTW
jgi:outer membrane autotransporter protein